MEGDSTVATTTVPLPVWGKYGGRGVEGTRHQQHKRSYRVAPHHHTWHQQDKTHNAPSQQDRVQLRTTCPTMNSPARQTSATSVQTRGSTTTRYGRTANVCVCLRFPFLEGEYTTEAAAEIVNWALKRDIEEYPDKLFV